MPITALNGIVTVFHVLYNSPDNAEEILNFGGIIGHSIYVRIDLISEFLFHWEFIKSMPQFLSFYLSLNIAIVGLAFIFELTRNLILGGQTFGGMFGGDFGHREKSERKNQLKVDKFHLHLLVFQDTPFSCSFLFVTKNLGI